MGDTDVVDEGTLKCVVFSPASRGLLAQITAIMIARVAPKDVRPLGDDALLLHTPAETEEIRDWISPVLPGDASVLVIEFERWSAAGGAVDARWLSRRGH